MQAPARESPSKSKPYRQQVMELRPTGASAQKMIFVSWTAPAYRLQLRWRQPESKKTATWKGCSFCFCGLSAGESHLAETETAQAEFRERPKVTAEVYESRTNKRFASHRHSANHLKNTQRIQHHPAVKYG